MNIKIKLYTVHFQSMRPDVIVSNCVFIGKEKDAREYYRTHAIDNHMFKWEEVAPDWFVKKWRNDGTEFGDYYKLKRYEVEHDTTDDKI